jgi:hypothetical protein
LPFRHDQQPKLIRTINLSIILYILGSMSLRERFPARRFDFNIPESETRGWAV